MTDAQFSRPGAIDLSSLAKAADASAPASAPADSVGGASWVTDVTEATFDQIAQLSMQHPVVLELWSPRAQGADQLSRDLAELTNAAQGSWLLGRVNVDTEPRIAQALQAQAVPMVVALLGGQVAPLFQGTRAREEISAVFDQIAQAAVANGMVTKAKPVGQAPAAGSSQSADEPPANPRFAAADAALERGDFKAALAEFDTLLAETPRDAEVQAGRAQAALLVRAEGYDASQVMAAGSERPDDLEAQFAAADVELMNNRAHEAFDRLLALVRSTAGDEREQVRVRLLELFSLLGNGDPRVLKARRELSTALF
ncbi:co-chaperone YbbN [Aestuariimicrobium soli]|uniref:co-chaperone YbbN n=1 Tax=Aestuariimicrobium soli TaxID=2035834 RepID=UPI003EBE41DA